MLYEFFVLDTLIGRYAADTIRSVDNCLSYHGRWETRHRLVMTVARISIPFWASFNTCKFATPFHPGDRSLVLSSIDMQADLVANSAMNTNIQPLSCAMSQRWWVIKSAPYSPTKSKMIRPVPFTVYAGQYHSPSSSPQTHRLGRAKHLLHHSWLVEDQLSAATR
jgi:hypothetical protein